MRTRIAQAVLAVSVLAIAAVIIQWQNGSGTPRADLVGAEVMTEAPTTSEPQPVRPPPPSTTEPSAEPFKATTLPPAQPRRISMPTLGVDAAIVDVGLEEDGSMEIPGVAEAGWYKHGPRPGAPFGSSVIAAHIDYADQPGVFIDLPKLQAGEPVVLTDEAGVVREYVVTERFQVNKGELPTDELFRSSGPAALTLITCGGTFDTSDRHYEDNIVVRAVPT